MAITASVGGVLTFKKLGFIYLFPERLHGRLKWVHRNVGALDQSGFLLQQQLIAITSINTPPCVHCRLAY